MPTYYTTAEEILPIETLRFSCGLVENDPRFDSVLEIHRDSAVGFVEGVINRPVLRRQSSYDFAVFGQGVVMMTASIPDFIALVSVSYVPDNSDDTLTRAMKSGMDAVIIMTPCPNTAKS